MNDGVHKIAAQNRSKLRTPYYLIDEARLLSNLNKIKYVREKSGARAVLALKCFSTWSVFPLMSKYMDGTTSSSLYEARLGHLNWFNGVQMPSVVVGRLDGTIELVRKFDYDDFRKSLS